MHPYYPVYFICMLLYVLSQLHMPIQTIILNIRILYITTSSSSISYFSTLRLFLFSTCNMHMQLPRHVCTQRHHHHKLSYQESHRSIPRLLFTPSPQPRESLSRIPCKPESYPALLTLVIPIIHSAIAQSTPPSPRRPHPPRGPSANFPIRASFVRSFDM